ncbi:hypothetical protein BDK51DRAFT_29601 [Blyttiomyces helicus]|uniref:Uncharacterized protein n=1 Tax=Blyttiomyces helicus TaxID=388810 RepID=A0A4P9VW61_9FUNG|nr:hypothetical protein BDK51DRAFT_29601 [Blyttiomyces helicus]|eukprot:RKO83921.1 hypothetical protein BDK51DRAFT_29601 [Blyttiomyces helicus]
MASFRTTEGMVNKRGTTPPEVHLRQDVKIEEDSIKKSMNRQSGRRRRSFLSSDQIELKWTEPEIKIGIDGCWTQDANSIKDDQTLLKDKMGSTGFLTRSPNRQRAGAIKKIPPVCDCAIGTQIEKHLSYRPPPRPPPMPGDQDLTPLPSAEPGGFRLHMSRLEMEAANTYP